MKTLFAAAVMCVLAGAAFAGEGQGNPYPYSAPSQTAGEQVFSPVGSAGEVQSVGSLPPGFENGTPVEQNEHHIIDSPTRTGLAPSFSPSPRG